MATDSFPNPITQEKKKNSLTEYFSNVNKNKKWMLNVQMLNELWM